MGHPVYRLRSVFIVVVYNVRDSTVQYSSEHYTVHFLLTCILKWHCSALCFVTCVTHFPVLYSKYTIFEFTKRTFRDFVLISEPAGEYSRPLLLREWRRTIIFRTAGLPGGRDCRRIQYNHPYSTLHIYIRWKHIRSGKYDHLIRYFTIFCNSLVFKKVVFDLWFDLWHSVIIVNLLQQIGFFKK